MLLPQIAEHQHVYTYVFHVLFLLFFILFYLFFNNFIYKLLLLLLVSRTHIVSGLLALVLLLNKNNVHTRNSALEVEPYFVKIPCLRVQA